MDEGQEKMDRSADNERTMNSTATDFHDVQTCSICLRSFNEQEIGLPDCCNHSFCAACLIKWIKVKPSCPLDRQMLKNIFISPKFNKPTIKAIRVMVENFEDYCENFIAAERNSAKFQRVLHMLRKMVHFGKHIKSLFDADDLIINFTESNFDNNYLSSNIILDYIGMMISQSFLQFHREFINFVREILRLQFQNVQDIPPQDRLVIKYWQFYSRHMQSQLSILYYDNDFDYCLNFFQAIFKFHLLISNISSNHGFPVCFINSDDSIISSTDVIDHMMHTIMQTFDRLYYEYNKLTAIYRRN